MEKVQEQCTVMQVIK